MSLKDFFHALEVTSAGSFLCSFFICLKQLTVCTKQYNTVLWLCEISPWKREKEKAAEDDSVAQWLASLLAT